MTSTAPLASGVPALSDLSLAVLRPLTRWEARGHLPRLCEAVLRRMARRRMR